MNKHLVRSIAITAIVLVFSIVVVVVPALAQTYYYRWAYAPAASCATVSTHVEVHLASQPVEWDMPAAGGAFNLVYIDNGAVQSVDGPFALAGSSSHVYGAFAESFPTYPAKFDFRIETLVNGHLVYTSTLSVTCKHDGETTATISNQSRFGGATEAAAATPSPCTDARINCHLYDDQIVLYGADSGTGIDVFMVDGSSEGQYLFTINAADFGSYLTNPPAQDMLIDHVGNVSVYILTTGEVQVNYGPDANGKTYVIIMSGIDGGSPYGYTLP
jgi:hypothetical protein